jgi:hypothetical protein
MFSRTVPVLLAAMALGVASQPAPISAGEFLLSSGSCVLTQALASDTSLKARVDAPSVDARSSLASNGEIRFQMLRSGQEGTDSESTTVVVLMPEGYASAPEARNVKRDPPTEACVIM